MTNEPPSNRRVPVWFWFALANTAVVALLGGMMLQQQLDQWQNKAPDHVPVGPEVARSSPDGLDGRREVEGAADGFNAPGGDDSRRASDAPNRSEPTSPVLKSVPGNAVAVETLLDRVGDGIVLITSLDENGQTEGLGSGFVIDSAGLVATNYHVISDATSATVQFRDGTKLDVRGCRAWSVEGDLAILEISGMPGAVDVLELAGDESPQQGIQVIAIGNPQGFKFVASQGVVSGVHRTAELPSSYREDMKAPADYTWIQTDAAISGGNSGGPLIDATGKVLGVNSWVAAGENLGFAAHVRHLRELRSKMQSAPVPLADVAAPTRRLDKLWDEFRSAMTWRYQQERGASREQLEELKRTPHPAASYSARFIEFAEQHRGTEAARDALLQVVHVCASDDSLSSGPALQKACARIVEDHANDEAIDSLPMNLAECELPETQQCLQALVDSNARAECRGLACFFLIGKLRAESEDGTNDAAIVVLLERLANEFSQVQVGNVRLGKVAEDELIVFKHLSVGKPAMEITGTDEKGSKFKLSDYRGKVVMLDFFGAWCPYCIRMFPHERDLVSVYKERPFVLLGVNTDPVGTLRELIANGQVTWRSWAEDGQSGPISEKWRITGFPTTFLIDHEGIIRYKFSGEPDTQVLDKAIDDLTRNVENAAAPAAPAAIPEPVPPAPSTTPAPDATPDAAPDATPKG